MNTKNLCGLCIHTNQREFLCLSKMERKERDEEMINNKTCRKLKRAYLKRFSSKEKKKGKNQTCFLQTNLVVYPSQNLASSFFS